jgi:hypothetical protein
MDCRSQHLCNRLPIYVVVVLILNLMAERRGVA